MLKAGATIGIFWWVCLESAGDSDFDADVGNERVDENENETIPNRCTRSQPYSE